MYKGFLYSMALIGFLQFACSTPTNNTCEQDENCTNGYFCKSGGCVRKETTNSCDSGVCKDSNSSSPDTSQKCRHQCAIPKRRCTSLGIPQQCAQDMNGCMVWESLPKCESGDKCEDGKCVEDCVKDGDKIRSDKPCCGRKQDDNGTCCSGNKCCNSDNNNKRSGGSCVCKEFHKRVNGSSDKDLRCTPHEPDLEITGWSARYYKPASGTGSITFCLNQDPDGTPNNRGNYIRYKNSSLQEANGFYIHFGLQSSSGQGYYCQDGMYVSSAKPNIIHEMTASFCCSFSVKTVPTGLYKMAIKIDFGNKVSEHNESNNVNTSRDDIDIP